MQAERIIERRFRCASRFVSLLPCSCNSGLRPWAADYQAAKDLYDQGEVAKARAGIFRSARRWRPKREGPRGGCSRPRADRLADPRQRRRGGGSTARGAGDRTPTNAKRAPIWRGCFARAASSAEAVRAAQDLSSCIERPDRDDLLTERAHASAWPLDDLTGVSTASAQVSAVGALAPPVSALKLQAALLRRHVSRRVRGVAQLFLADLQRRPTGVCEGAGSRDLPRRRE